MEAPPVKPSPEASSESSSDAEHSDAAHDLAVQKTETIALTAEGAAEIFKMKRDHVKRDTMSAKVCADPARLAAGCVSC